MDWKEGVNECSDTQESRNVWTLAMGGTIKRLLQLPKRNARIIVLKMILHFDPRQPIATNGQWNFSNIKKFVIYIRCPCKLNWVEITDMWCTGCYVTCIAYIWYPCKSFPELVSLIVFPATLQLGGRWRCHWVMQTALPRDFRKKHNHQK